MPSRADIVAFPAIAVPEGESPWVRGQETQETPVVVTYDDAWPGEFDRLAARLDAALGPRVLLLQHVGSTSVPGLAAKPIIDADLVVADPEAEPGYLPALEALGFELRVREPWWFGHRCLRGQDPRSNLHVFGPESPEPWKHRVFRDHLRRDTEDRDRYAALKREAADDSAAAGESTMAYNARKERLIHEIYARAFAAAGLT
ncbi:hypothetical protein GCM10011519_18060 [Marmoricola endophyticus]|uniref:GrpB family protein n=1 Tax=Marmoricola endophyticus TaxID=2040280 RepID=A0A917F391_9ACTN|nr:GrpB family protein [Marmoricola endophyticus]GGF44560.1 hypothetical protein GCM10011519_18060 [Marmoricola endophyticus]